MHNISSARLLTRAAVLATALTAVPVTGQQPAREWINVTRAVVKSNANQQFEGLLKEVAAAYRKQNMPFYVVYQVVYGNLNEYITVAPVHKFAELDGPSVIVRALGQDGSDRLMRQLRDVVSDVRRVAAIPMPELQISAPPDDSPFYIATLYSVAPGRNADFESWVKADYLPAMKKAEVKRLLVSRAIFGSNPNQYALLRPLRALADIDAGPPMVRALGQEGADRANARLSGVVQSTEYMILRYRPELGHMAAPTSAGLNH